MIDLGIYVPFGAAISCSAVVNMKLVITDTTFVVDNILQAAEQQQQNLVAERKLLFNQLFLHMIRLFNHSFEHFSKTKEALFRFLTRFVEIKQSSIVENI